MSQFTSNNYVTRTLNPSTFGGKHVVVFLVVVGVKVVVMANSHRAGDEAPETIPQVGHVEPGRPRERLGSPKETGSPEGRGEGLVELVADPPELSPHGLLLLLAEGGDVRERDRAVT